MKPGVRKYLLDRIGSFRRRENGSATVEVVLWLPLFFAAFALITDLAVIFHGQSQVMRVVQDANRNLSVGRLKTVQEAEDFITTRLAPMSPNATALTTVDAGLITSTVTVPVSDLEFIGFFGALSEASMKVASQHLIEY